MKDRDHSPAGAVALPRRGRAWHEPGAPAVDNAVEAAHRAEHDMRVGLEGETLTVEVGDHRLLPDWFEGVVIDCLQGVCRAPAGINAPPPWDATHHVVCMEDHDVTIGPSQLTHVLGTRR